MLTLYTGIGHLTVQKNKSEKALPIVIMNGQEYALADCELLLWSSLAFQILTLEELEHSYNAALKYQKISETPDFSYVLRRLLMRGLVAEGTGVTGVDALYRLLSQMHLTPVRENFPLRLLTCLRLWLGGHLTLSGFSKYLKKPENTQLELFILKLSKELSFSVAELLSYMDISTAPPTQTALRQTCNTMKIEELAEQTTLHHVQYPVLQSIANLYLKKQIVLNK